MKQLLNVFVVLCFAAILLCACNGKKPINWQLNKDEHWKLTESGEIKDKDVHKWEENCCSVCGAEMTRYEAETWILRYDENGSLVRMIVLDGNGAVAEDFRREYTYDDAGNCIAIHIYDHDVISVYQEYTIINYKDHISSYKTRQVNYLEDGTKKDQTYDYNGWVIRDIFFTASGEKEYDYTYYYIINDLGQNVKALVSEDDKPVFEIEYTYDDAGALKLASYYRDGELFREDHYDENGNLIADRND